MNILDIGTTSLSFYVYRVDENASQKKEVCSCRTNCSMKVLQCSDKIIMTYEVWLLYNETG